MRADTLEVMDSISAMLLHPPGNKGGRGVELDQNDRPEAPAG